MNKYNPPYIDSEEKDLIEEIEKADSEALNRSTEENQSKMLKAAKEYVRAEAKMNIRIEEGELQKIKDRAAREGLKYQTLVKSVMHKYLTGQLVEKK